MTEEKPEDEKFWIACDPSMTLLRHGYQKSMKGWRNERIRRIADELKVEIPHLCAVGGVFSKFMIKKYYKNNRWPMHLILTFMRIEAFLNQRGTGIREINPDDAAIALLISRGTQRPEPRFVTDEDSPGCLLTKESIKTAADYERERQLTPA